VFGCGTRDSVIFTISSSRGSTPNTLSNVLTANAAASPASDPSRDTLKKFGALGGSGEDLTGRAT
jgi:hypothetical protein